MSNQDRIARLERCLLKTVRALIGLGGVSQNRALEEIEQSLAESIGGKVNGLCETAHFLLRSSADGKSLTQEPHHKHPACREWRAGEV
jgi:hypothetical protein